MDKIQTNQEINKTVDLQDEAPDLDKVHVCSTDQVQVLYTPDEETGVVRIAVVYRDMEGNKMAFPLPLTVAEDMAMRILNTANHIRRQRKVRSGESKCEKNQTKN